MKGNDKMKDLEVNVIIYNLYRAKFQNNETGETRYMTRVSYLLDQDASENMIGANAMVCYVNDDAFTKLRNKLMKPVKATIHQRLEKNGSKFVITKIDDIKTK